MDSYQLSRLRAPHDKKYAIMKFAEQVDKKIDEIKTEAAVEGRSIFDHFNQKALKEAEKFNAKLKKEGLRLSVTLCIDDRNMWSYHNGTYIKTDKKLKDKIKALEDLLESFVDEVMLSKDLKQVIQDFESKLNLTKL